MLNEQIIRAGYAVPLTIEPNVKFRKKIEDAYITAVKEKRGLWDKNKAKAVFAEKIRPAGNHSRKRGKKRSVKTSSGPQVEVSGQVEVSEQNEVSGSARHLK